MAGAMFFNIMMLISPKKSKQTVVTDENDENGNRLPGKTCLKSKKNNSYFLGQVYTDPNQNQQRSSSTKAKVTFNQDVEVLYYIKPKSKIQSWRQRKTNHSIVIIEELKESVEPARRAYKSTFV